MELHWLRKYDQLRAVHRSNNRTEEGERTARVAAVLMVRGRWLPNQMARKRNRVSDDTSDTDALRIRNSIRQAQLAYTSIQSLLEHTRVRATSLR